MEQYFGSGGILAQRLSHFEFRSAQLEMAQAVSDCLGEEKPLLVEAGTGTGKTWAYLVAAVASGKKVVVSTGTKTLQDQILDHDVPLLRQHLFPKLKVVCLKGRKNYLCRRRLKDFAYQPTFWNREEAKLFRRLQTWAQRTRTGDRSEIDWLPDRFQTWDEVSSSREQCLGQDCDEQTGCFLARARQQAAQSQLVIVNHHLFVADLAVRRGGYGEVIPEYQAVIFDEAHQLEDVVGLYFGLQFSLFKLSDLRRNLSSEIKRDGGKTKDLPSLQQTVQQLEALERLLPVDLMKSAGQPGRYRLDLQKVGAGFLDTCRKILGAMSHIAELLSRHKEGNPGLESCHQWSLELSSTLQTLLAQKDSGFVYWFELTQHSLALHGTPIEVAQIVRQELFKKVTAVVMTSATLSVAGSFDYFRNALGIPDDRREVLLRSPFSYEDQAILYIPGKFPLPHESAFCPSLAEESLRILQKTRGRALFLFTSYRNLYELHRHLKDRLPFPLLVQGQKTKRALLSEFKDKVDSVLFATSSFWQGIDVPGEALSCLLIDKLPFEVPDDPVTAARMEYVTGQGRNSFYQYQVPRAVIQLKQGVGRLIRSSHDRGIVALFDMRLRTKSYGQLFLKSLPGFRVVDSPAALDHFLDNEPAKSTNS
jgi:ATP-dependent DNA helicase DinG